MAQVRSEQPRPPSAGDKRQTGERRDNPDRRQTLVVWSGTERRQADERRAWVGRRQAAEWRLT